MQNPCICHSDPGSSAPETCFLLALNGREGVDLHRSPTGQQANDLGYGPLATTPAAGGCIPLPREACVRAYILTVRSRW